MALITAGAAPIVPASPMPLTPSGFVGDGVTVWSSLSDGTSLAAGTRYSASVDVCRLPSESNTASSNNAWASPWITPPWICPSTISGLTCTPQSSTAT